MPKLVITPAELREKASEMDRLRETHLQLMKQLRIIVYGLQDSWKGEAQTAFVEKFNSMSNRFTTMETSLHRYAEVAREAAAKSEQADSELLSRVRGID